MRFTTLSVLVYFYLFFYSFRNIFHTFIPWMASYSLMFYNVFVPILVINNSSYSSLVISISFNLI